MCIPGLVRQLTDIILQESSQKTISLKSDDPDAVEEVLRKIYGCALEKYNQRPWEFWFNLVITADKYLEPKLSAKASERLRASALALTDGDAIFDLITTIQRDMGHLEPFLQFADQIRKDNLKTLLDNEKYRALLDGDKTLLWSHLDELKAAAGLSEPSDSSGKSDLPDLSSFVERTYSFCHKHDPPVCINDTQHSQHMWCFRCRDQVQCEQHKVWLPK